MPSPSGSFGQGQAVTGAEEFAAALRKAAPAVRRQMDRRNRAIGQKVVGLAKQKASTPQQAAAATSLRATAARGGVAINLGRGVPFALGAEFGAKKYPQFPPWTGNQWSGIPEDVGYFMHPALRDSVPEVVDEYFAAVKDACAQSGLRMTPTRMSAFDIGF